MRIALGAALALFMACATGAHVLANTGEDAEPNRGSVPADGALLREIAAQAAVRDAEERRQLADFYAGRDNRPLWLDARGLNPRGERVLAEIARADDWGLNAADFDLPANVSGTLTLADAEIIQAELKLTLAVLKYARRARSGRFDPRQLSRAIDRTPPLLEPGTVLEGIASSADPGAYLR